MSSDSKSDNKLDFEIVLTNEIGGFGKYQLINILLLAIPAAISGFMAGDYIFTAARLPHRCVIPYCDRIDPDFSPDWLHNAVPATSTGYDECHHYAVVNFTENFDYETCPASMFDRNTILSCDSYVYERTNSVVYDFGLECAEWLRALAGTLNSVGGMVCLPLAGFISDYFGRRTSIVFFSFNIALVGFVRSFSVNYYMYVCLQFLQVAIGGGAFSAAYILATEIVGPKYRVVTSATMSSMFALGQVLLGTIAFLITEWRTLSLVLFTPVFLLVSYRWLITESYRWLLSKNKHENAKNSLESAARMNGKKISESAMNYLLTAILNERESNETVKGKNLFVRVLKSKTLLRRCCTTPVWWITTTFVYYGLSINSVNLTGNMYLNYIATAAIEIPGYWTAALLLDRIGRKVVLLSGYMMCAICCISFAFVPNTYYGLSLTLFLTGKFCIALVMTSLYLFTSELYPTRQRHSFLGFSSMMGRIGSIASPLTPPLMMYWEGIPTVMFGSLAVISALLVLTQPETLGLKLPDTFEDAEKIQSSSSK